MIRLPDWEDRLSAYLAAREKAEFRFGKMDCALFAAGAVEAMTGEDPAAQWRGRYRSHAGSVRQIRKAGHKSLVSLVSDIFEEIPPAFARRGDIVADRAGSLGVCIGAAALFVGEEDGAPGLIRVGLIDWSTAWRIEFGD